nr:hypothetical protein [Tanacetum cinerariifolium]
MKPADTLLMRDEDSSTNLVTKTNKFINSSVDDLVPIPRESEVTLDSNLECDIPIDTPFPTTDVKEGNFDVNSPLGEHVVDFLIENEDTINLPRHLVKYLFSYLVKHPSSTQRMFDEPLGDDLKLRSYDVTFSNSLFNFNDDFTLRNDNSLFDEEVEEISSLDPLISAPLNYEPLGNPNSVSRSLETNDLILEELTVEIGLDDSIQTEINDVLPKKSTLLVTPLPDYEHIFLKEVERFYPFFSLTQLGGKTRVIETPSFGFHHMPSPRPAAYSPKEVWQWCTRYGLRLEAMIGVRGLMIGSGSKPIIGSSIPCSRSTHGVSWLEDLRILQLAYCCDLGLDS